MVLTTVLLLHVYMFVIGNAQAPGDEDSACTYYIRQIGGSNSGSSGLTLMRSSNYVNLLESNGGPWIVVDEDDNNNELMGNSTPTVCSLAC